MIKGDTWKTHACMMSVGNTHVMWCVDKLFAVIIFFPIPVWQLWRANFNQLTIKLQCTQMNDDFTRQGQRLAHQWVNNHLLQFIYTFSTYTARTFLAVCSFITRFTSTLIWIYSINTFSINTWTTNTII
jgi:hypothetical protein